MLGGRCASVATIEAPSMFAERVAGRCWAIGQSGVTLDGGQHMSGTPIRCEKHSSLIR